MGTELERATDSVLTVAVDELPIDSVRHSSGRSTAQPDTIEVPVSSETSGAMPELSIGDHIDLVVRSIRARDIPSLARLGAGYQLNQPETGLSRFSLAGEAVRAVVPGGRSRPRIFVACAGDRLVGFVYFQAALPDRRWHAIAMGTATGVYDGGPVEDALLRHAITAAGLRGVKRLYARVPSGTDAVETFCRSGFSPYATETVFVLDEASGGGLPGHVRPQEATDTWAIHQLYNATAPRQVQYAEALTSHRWELSTSNELARGTECSGWLVDDGHAVAAYGRVTRGKTAIAIELLYLPDKLDMLRGLLEAVLRSIRHQQKGRRIYCVLRGYQAEAATELEARGFEPGLEQDLLVKYTTATARVAHSEPIALHAEVIERLPKRVPSFLHQQPRDEIAG